MLKEIDGQRLTAAIYCTGKTPAEFARIMGTTPKTMERKAKGLSEWRRADISAFHETMKSLSGKWGAGDLDSVFFPRSDRRGGYKKPFALAVIEYGLGVTEQEAASKAGLSLEALRALYNACRSSEQLATASKVWEAWGYRGDADGFYKSFMDYQD